MSDALWAARQGDALAHSSMMADVLGGVLEVAAGVIVGGLVGAAVIGAAGLTVATGGLGACVLGAVVGVAVGAGMSLSGADAGISQFCESLANAVFAPTVHAHISSGSSNVFINGLPAVRSGDRSTCDATVVSSGLISPNVRISGDKLEVREIRSGKTPGVGLAVSALMLLKDGAGKFVSNLTIREHSYRHSKFDASAWRTPISMSDLEIS